MGFFSNLLSTAAPVVGGLLGGAPGAAIGGLAGGLLGGSPYKFTVPDISGRYNELSPQIQAIISQLQQGGLDTRPYDAMRKNNELGAFNTAKRMNEVLNQNLSARGLSNSSIRTSGNQGIYAKALADMATRWRRLTLSRLRLRTLTGYSGAACHYQLFRTSCVPVRTSTRTRVN